jgi:hypothetical protein
VFLTESAQSIGVIAIFLAVVLRRNVDMEAPVLLTNRQTSSQGEAISSQEKFYGIRSFGNGECRAWRLNDKKYSTVFGNATTFAA